MAGKLSKPYLGDVYKVFRSPCLFCYFVLVSERCEADGLSLAIDGIIISG